MQIFRTSIAKLLAIVLFLSAMAGVALACTTERQQPKLTVKPINNVNSVVVGRNLQFNAYRGDKQQDSVKWSVDNVGGGGTTSLENITINKDTGLLSVGANATVDSKIKVYAEQGVDKSDEYELSIEGVKANSITISSAEIINGQAVEKLPIFVSVVLNPSDTTSTPQLVATQGAEFVEIGGYSNNSFIVSLKDSAATNTVVLKASVDSVVSNELAFSVVTDTAIDIDLSDYIMTVGNTNIDYNGNRSLDLSLSKNGVVVDDVSFEYRLLAGNEFLGINNNQFSIKGHGQARVRVLFNDGLQAYYKDIDLKVIVPPLSFDLPQWLIGQLLNIKTSFTWGCDDELPFNAIPQGYATIADTMVSQDYTVVVGDGDIGSFDLETETITFEPIEGQQEIKIKIQSQSGSVTETTREFTIQLNDGVNVSTHYELKQAVNDISDEGDYYINIVDDMIIKSLADITGDINDDFDLATPELVGNVVQEEIIQAYQELQIVKYLTSDSSLNIAGNGYAYDWSHLRVLSGRENIVYGGVGIVLKGISMFSFRGDGQAGWPSDENDVLPTVDFSMSDISIKGNTGYLDEKGNPNQYNGISDDGFLRSFHYQLLVGEFREAVLNNVNLSSNNIGLRVELNLDFKLLNSDLDNSYAHSIKFIQSIGLFKDNTFGVCGGFSIIYDMYASANIYWQGQDQTLTFDNNKSLNIHGATDFLSKLASLGGGFVASLATMLTNIANNIVDVDNTANPLLKATINNNISYDTTDTVYNFFMFSIDDVTNVLDMEKTIIIDKQGSTKTFNDTAQGIYDKYQANPSQGMQLNTTDKYFYEGFKVGTTSIKFFLINSKLSA